MKPIDEVLQSTARALGQSLERVFADLAVLAGATTDILAAPGTSRTKPESLRPVVDDIVTGQAGLVDSAGVSVTPGLFSDAGAWHQAPASINYYDYTEMTWYERPLASGQPELIGPYIDFGGADMKIVTASLPVLQEKRAVAVAGADLSMESIERTFLLNLGRRDEHVALITETGKVVASNSARFAPGTRFEGPRSRSGSVPVPVADLASPPWHLIADR